MSKVQYISSATDIPAGQNFAHGSEQFPSLPLRLVDGDHPDYQKLT
jgi:hypothetical protein